MAKLTMGVQVDGLKELTKALDEFNHNRSYIDGLEAWILRSEADNERLREQIEQLKQPARGVDHWRTLAAWLEQEYHFTRDELTAAQVIQLLESAKRLNDEMIRVDAALGLSQVPKPRDPSEPLHPRLWEIEKLKTTIPAGFDPSWHGLAEWAHKTLKVPEGDATAPHILRALKEHAVTLDKARDRILSHARALEFARAWFAGESRHVTLEQARNRIEAALKC